MFLTTHQTTAGRGDHLVHFYESDDDLAGTVGRYLATAVLDDATIFVIASESHVCAFQRELGEWGVDAGAIGSIVFLDARTTLDRLLVDGAIDADAFDRAVARPLRAAVAGGTTVRAYGEMVDLLWQAGDLTGAIALERLWNQLIDELGFSLLCAYAADSFTSSPEHAEALHEVCRHHSGVSARPDEAQEAWCEFAPSATAPRAARRFLEETFQQWEIDGAVMLDARLLLSELVTNAVVHAGSPLAVAIRRQDSRLWLAVRDEHPAPPVPRPDNDNGLGGHGLRLVALLADAWGVEETATGKSVWFELTASET